MLALKPDAAAEQIGVSRAYLYRLISAGVLPSVKIGRSRRILLADLERFLEDHRVGGDTDAE